MGAFCREVVPGARRRLSSFGVGFSWATALMTWRLAEVRRHRLTNHGVAQLRLILDAGRRQHHVSGS